MKYFSAIFCTFLILLSLGLARDIELPKEEQTSIIYNSQVYNLDENPVHQDPNQSREQIDLIVEDFETTAGDWDPSEDGQPTPLSITVRQPATMQLIIFQQMKMVNLHIKVGIYSLHFTLFQSLVMARQCTLIFG